MAKTRRLKRLPRAFRFVPAFILKPLLNLILLLATGGKVKVVRVYRG